jgi:hypothetical protein
VRTHAAVLAVFVAAATGAACTIDTDDGGFNISFTEQQAPDFRWQGAVPAGQTLEIKGVNGSINATPAPGGQVQIVAIRKGRSDPAKVKIDVVQHQGGVTVCAVYPTAAGEEPNVCQPGEGGHLGARRSNVSVTFNVQVPAGVEFVARTTNGSIDATGLKGNVVARTSNGSVKFVTDGYGEASTTNGSITATLGRADWPKELAFRTVNGSIHLNLPVSTQTSVDATCVNGRVTVDFPVSAQAEATRQHVAGTIGAGGRDLKVATVNGGVHIAKAGAAGMAGSLEF